MQRPSPHSTSPVRQAQDKPARSHPPPAVSQHLLTAQPAGTCPSSASLCSPCCPARRARCGLCPPAPTPLTGKVCVDTFRSQLLQVCHVAPQSCHLRYKSSFSSLPSAENKWNGRSSPGLTCGRRRPGSLGVNTKLVYLTHKSPMAFDVCL